MGISSIIVLIANSIKCKSMKIDENRVIKDEIVGSGRPLAEWPTGKCCTHPSAAEGQFISIDNCCQPKT